MNNIELQQIFDSPLMDKIAKSLLIRHSNINLINEHEYNIKSQFKKFNFDSRFKLINEHDYNNINLIKKYIKDNIYLQISQNRHNKISKETLLQNAFIEISNLITNNYINDVLTSVLSPNVLFHYLTQPNDINNIDYKIFLKHIIQIIISNIPLINNANIKSINNNMNNKMNNPVRENIIYANPVRENIIYANPVVYNYSHVYSFYQYIPDNIDSQIYTETQNILTLPSNVNIINNMIDSLLIPNQNNHNEIYNQIIQNVKSQTYNLMVIYGYVISQILQVPNVVKMLLHNTFIILSISKVKYTINKILMKTLKPEIIKLKYHIFFTDSLQDIIENVFKTPINF